jgi:hypothetical protein
MTMKLPTTAQPSALVLALRCAAAPLAHADEEQVAVETNPPITFMTGGIGQSDAAATRKAGKAFNLRIEFSARKDDEFVADADLKITDRQGHPVFVLYDADPIVNVNLPDGRYRVAASFDGQTENRIVTVHGKAGNDLYFHWNGQAKGDPDAATTTHAPAARG